MKKIVIPGEILGKHAKGSVKKEDGVYYSTVLGLATYGDDDSIRVIPLKSKYIPHTGDVVLGVVVDSRMFGYFVDIDTPKSAVLPGNESRTPLSEGVLISAKVKSVDDGVVLTSPRILHGGRLIDINPAKTPRVIGKNKSMVMMIKELTNTSIIVGMNGKVWLNGDPQDIKKAVMAINEIQDRAHTSGLTDYIKSMLNGDSNEE